MKSAYSRDSLGYYSILEADINASAEDIKLRYRNKAKNAVGIPIDELAEILPSDSNTAQAVIEKQTAEHLQKEIAYLFGPASQP